MQIRGFDWYLYSRNWLLKQGTGVGQIFIYLLSKIPDLLASWELSDQKHPVIPVL